MTNPNEHNLESRREGNEQIELIPMLNINAMSQKGRMLCKFKAGRKMFILFRNLDSSVSEEYFSHYRCVSFVQ